MKGRLVRNDWQSVPSRPEGCGYDPGSTKQGDQLSHEHDLVEVEPDIVTPVRSCLLVQGYRSAHARMLPTVVEAVDPQEGRIEKGIPPTGAMLRGQCGQLQRSKVHQVSMSKKMRCV